jgi:hypothetical protein
MYERVALLAISEQQEHHAAAMRLEAMQTQSLQDHRDKAKDNAKKTQHFKKDGNGPKLTVRSVELV